MSETLQKTVRLPAELVDYVESQEGRDFSKKLVTLLNDIREGDDNRCRVIAHYNKVVAERSQQLRMISRTLNDAQVVTQRLEYFADSVDNILERYGRCISDES